MDIKNGRTAFGRQSRENTQAPLVVDVKTERSARRKPTSRLEQLWPVYLGVGIPAIVFLGICGILIFYGLGNSSTGLGPLVIGVPFLLISFIVSALVLTYVLSSLRNSAETLGNLTFLSASNTGFKIGAAIGFGLFLYFTPIVFGDPFTGNRSAPSAIVAQLILKALGFMGIAGAIGSRLEKSIRKAPPQSQ